MLNTVTTAAYALILLTTAGRIVAATLVVRHGHGVLS
jgi:hypothetical protein